MEKVPGHKDDKLSKMKIAPVLKSLENLVGSSKELIIEGDNIELILQGQKVFKTNGEEIIFLGENLEERIRREEEVDGFDSKLVSEFLNNLSTRAERLNHMGLSYFVSDIDSEKSRIAQKANEIGLEVYEENSGLENESWLFVGNRENPESPLFEIVLSKGPEDSEVSWKPHFQIDLDTNLTIEEIEELQEVLGPDIDTWKLDVPNLGPVLWMANLGKTGGVRIALGLGTNFRNTRWHRENGLELVEV